MEIVPGAQPPDDVRTNLPAAGVNGLQSLTSAMSHVATALEQLKDQLEIANQRVAEVTRSQTPEVQLGELFTRAARYTDNAMTAAEEAAGRVVAGARTEAQAILAGARTQAEAIVAGARIEADAIGPGPEGSVAVQPALEEMAITMNELARVNTELATEMELIRAMLATSNHSAQHPEALATPASSGLPSSPPSSTPWLAGDTFGEQATGQS